MRLALKDEVLNRYMKAVFASAALSLLVQAATFVQIAYPFIMNTKLSRLVIYSMTIFAPLVLDILFGLVNIRTGMAGFFVLSSLFHLLLFYFISLSFIRSKDKRKYLFRLAAIWTIYVLCVTYYLW